MKTKQQQQQTNHKKNGKVAFQGKSASGKANVPSKLEHFSTTKNLIFRETGLFVQRTLAREREKINKPGK